MGTNGLPDGETGNGVDRPGVPPILDLQGAAAYLPPSNLNDPRALLEAWTALEALAPQTYKPEEIERKFPGIKFDLRKGLPWETVPAKEPEPGTYHEIVLGCVPMVTAVERMIAAFGDDDALPRKALEVAAIAAVVVDDKGCVVGTNPVGISSFAWALPMALDGNVGALGVWRDVEHRVVAALLDILSVHDEDGKPVPLDAARIAVAYHWLVRQFGLGNGLANPPTTGITKKGSTDPEDAPGASLLNSFFMDDLAAVAAMVETNSVPAGLRAYLGLQVPEAIVDLLTDRSGLEAAVAPELVPAARWPSPGGHPLVLLQQAAVNVIRKELAGREGILAVNGPPGTGKTTLLRDVVASAILDRASAMAEFTDPNVAFADDGRLKLNEKISVSVSRLDASLKGHEVMVASSNNKAVENVSKELPAIGAMGDGPGTVRYFKSVSDRLHAEPDDKDKKVQGKLADTWGMVAGVLGNSRNRGRFSDRFWWDGDRGFRLYLQAARGGPRLVNVTDKVTGVVTQEEPTVVSEEKPPSSAKQALAKWKRVRSEFLATKAEVNADLVALGEMRDAMVALDKGKSRIQILETTRSRLRDQADDDAVSRDVALAEAARARLSVHEHQARMTTSLANRPGLLSRLFRRAYTKAWVASHAALGAVAASAQLEAGASEAVAALATSTATKSARSAEASLMALRSALDALEQLALVAGKARGDLGARVVDDAFFARPHDEKHLLAPWVPDSLHLKRERLFVAAMAIHRAFVDAAARPVSSNLHAAMSLLKSGAANDADLRSVAVDMWATLFMVVPLLSTTFASVERMMGYLPPGSIGWLLVDEAGQAAPQAAVGAIMRSRRIVVVGDPLQIPPVTSLPPRLVGDVCRHFNVDATKWAATEASVQTVSDRASRYRSSFRTDTGTRPVGVPLLVHRRCQEPMFGISNRIAYDSQMVHAVTGPKPGDVGRVLGPSRWFDVDGTTTSNWCPAEGELVVGLLRRLARAGICKPDVFIITAFRAVAEGMRDILEKEATLGKAFGVKWKDWCSDRVGTIHTVQGREAETVIFVLGAPMAMQRGARDWATDPPNSLNVAVSRAKQNLYVVGSRSSWASSGHAHELAALPDDDASFLATPTEADGIVAVS